MIIVPQMKFVWRMKYCPKTFQRAVRSKILRTQPAVVDYVSTANKYVIVWDMAHIGIHILSVAYKIQGEVEILSQMTKFTFILIFRLF